ncbi:hypothetical protein AVEN_134542-1, partial [Araneus ventricosus]
DEEDRGTHSRGCQAVLQIGSLVLHPAVVSDMDWRLDVVKFLFLHSFFKLHTPTEDILHEAISSLFVKALVLREDLGFHLAVIRRLIGLLRREG